IAIFGRYLVENKIATKEDLTAVEDKAEAEVIDAVEFAETSPEPAPETLFDHIYVDETVER
ncbi:MAG: pyruvate dehydrogenase (acetyl-transferring) E1 component subunit alpha, partial [Chloroflexi bacterium]|nr:pyruvate dehydrogenase (acetyl-transferring) E1 component subunit alpha [Chloroflexota bacterium]